MHPFECLKWRIDRRSDRVGAGEIEQIFYRGSGRVRPGIFQREPRENACRGLLGKIQRQQTHLRALVNLERETVFRRFLKHLHLLMSEDFLFFAWFLIRPFSSKATLTSPAVKIRDYMVQGSQRWKAARPSDHSDATVFIRQTPYSGADTLQKNNVRKLGNRKRTSIASPRQSVNKMEEIL